ncbi:MAG: hypothetical protein KF690_08850 [Bacteroidetes bacterium]|nr:hypothetical protein [Bacteroidota bacterium]
MPKLPWILLVLYGAALPRLHAQETLRVVSYNLLNYPNVSTIPKREDTLRVILEHLNPHILLFQELNTEQGANSILRQSLESWAPSRYTRAQFVPNATGASYNQHNMLYYDSTLLRLKSQQRIPTQTRDISIYTVYWKDPSAGADTVFLDIFALHHKAGNTASDRATRHAEADSLRKWLTARPGHPNRLLLGDFNVYRADEPAYRLVTSADSMAGYFRDPIQQPGNWNDNAGFAGIHTQSTRTASFGGGATGGLDDRFDQILISPALYNGAHGFTYISGSYQAVSNDGNHFNQSLLAAPPNTTLPYPVLSALYHMSDHLPVTLELRLDETVATARSKPPDARPATAFKATNPVQQTLHLHYTGITAIEGTLQVRDLTGRILLSEPLQVREGGVYSTETGHLCAGSYWLFITGQQGLLLHRQLLLKP